MVLDKCYAVMAAVTALVETALPSADVRFNPPKAFKIKAEGAVAVLPGEAEELPDSPLRRALLQHGIPIFLGVQASAGMATADAARALSAAIEAAVVSNRRLGGLVDHLWVSPEFTGLTAVEALGAEASDWASLTLMAEYSVDR